MKTKLLLLSLLLLTSHLSLATIRYVSKTGSSTPPYTTWATASDSIQKCIKISRSGDTVYVANGVYEEQIILIDSLTLIGMGIDSCVIDTRQLLSGNNYYAVVMASYSSIEGFYIKVSDNYSQIGISNFVVRKTKIKNNKIEKANYGVSSNFSNSIISNNIISAQIGVILGGGVADEVLIEGNTITVYGSDFGIQVTAGTRPTIINNVIYLNNGFAAGINPGGSDTTKILNNVILAESAAEGIFNVSLPTYCINNFLIGKFRLDGVLVQPEENNRVINNVIINSPKGIRCRAQHNSQIQYNNSWNNGINFENFIPDSTNLSVDPMIVNDNMDSLDFQLQMYSPLMDAGDPNILDIDGSRSDIGLFGGPYGQIYTYHDLAPKPPRNLTASVQGKAVTLKWNKNTEADLFRYRVYRDTVPNFIYDTTKIIGVTADTFFVDMLGKKQEYNKYYYKLTAIDSAINQSAASEEVQVTITGMPEAPPIVVEEYKLLQNYPNPFNPSTTIPYRLKSPAYVKVMVYNILGELVRVLVNHHQSAGYYELDFTPNSKETTKGREAIREFETFYYGDIVSGIYLYRIEVIGEGDIPVFTDLKKMLMVK